MNLIDRLDKIDRKRESLHIYETRLRRLFFARALRDRQLARINRRWRALSDERAHILALITADPVLKQQFYDRERAQLTKIDNQEVTAHDLRVAASDLGAYYTRELKAKQAHHDAVVFAKWADAGDNIPIQEREAVRNRFLTAYQMIRSERLSKQKDFEDLITARYPRQTEAISARETYMREALKAQTERQPDTPAPSAFAQWYQLRTGKSLTQSFTSPTKTAEKTCSTQNPDPSPQRRR